MTLSVLIINALTTFHKKTTENVNPAYTYMPGIQDDAPAAMLTLAGMFCIVLTDVSSKLLVPHPK